MTVRPLREAKGVQGLHDRIAGPRSTRPPLSFVLAESRSWRNEATAGELRPLRQKNAGVHASRADRKKS